MWKRSGQHRTHRRAVPAHGKFALPSNHHEWPLYLVFLRLQPVIGTIEGRHSGVMAWSSARVCGDVAEFTIIVSADYYNISNGYPGRGG